MAAPQQPDAAARLRTLLTSMGVHDYEPRVVHQLLEFQQTYLTEIFEDGAIYAEHAGRPGQLECEDVQLATRLRAAIFQTTAPKLLESMAKDRNRSAIRQPPVPGIQLPEAHLCLVQENWQLTLPPVEPADTTSEPADRRAGGAPVASSQRRITINLANQRPGGPEPMALG